jgi:hypothetical protein
MKKQKIFRVRTGQTGKSVSVRDDDAASDAGLTRVSIDPCENFLQGYGLPGLRHAEGASVLQAGQARQRRPNSDIANEFWFTLV